MTIKIVSEDQYRRAVQALADTEKLIAKEKSYRHEFQKAGYIDELERHCANLKLAMLEWGAEDHA